MIYVRVIIGLLALVGVSGGVVYGVWRGLSALQRHFGIEGHGQRKVLPGSDDALGKAGEIAERVYKLISRHEGEHAIYGDFRLQIQDLTEARLPKIVESRHRLLRYLGRKEPQSLWAEVEECKRKLEGCRDDDLRAVLEKNLELAAENEASYKRMQMLLEKTNARVKQVLLGLRNLEDKIVSIDLADGGEQRELTGSLGGLLGDVKLLEEEYKKLDLV